jgi:hypothetical protein
MKKTGLGSDPLSWITPTTPDNKEEKQAKKTEYKTPKFKTFDVRLTVLFRDDQLTFLDKIVREINKNRESEYKKERITKNTMLRVLVDVFKNVRLNLKNISDEKDLLVRISEVIKK